MTGKTVALGGVGRPIRPRPVTGQLRLAALVRRHPGMSVNHHTVRRGTGSIGHVVTIRSSAPGSEYVATLLTIEDDSADAAYRRAAEWAEACEQEWFGADPDASMKPMVTDTSTTAGVCFVSPFSNVADAQRQVDGFIADWRRGSRQAPLAAPVASIAHDQNGQDYLRKDASRLVGRLCDVLLQALPYLDPGSKLRDKAHAVLWDAARADATFDDMEDLITSLDDDEAVR